MAANSCELFRFAESEPSGHFAKPLPSTSAHTTVSRALRSSGQHNGDTGDVLRAAAKPGLAIEL